MNCISLWDPWGTFVSLGLKTIETRSWETPYRGRLAIHVAKNRKAIRDGTPNRLLEESGLVRTVPKFADDFNWPLGKIVAVCTLEDCVPTTSRHSRLVGMQFHESKLGDYSEGRFAWLLSDVQRLWKPVPCHGYQKLWGLAPDVERMVEAACAA